MMGKKSRLKREKKQKKTINNIPLNNIAQYDELLRFLQSHISVEDSIPQIKERLISIFSQYSSIDIFLSLSISELWLPNISSQVKHILMLNIFLSMQEEQFTSAYKVDDYTGFEHLLNQIYSTLPSFPILEDYIPEQDWGEIKYYYKDSNYQIFYGGLVERLPDYIKAFELRYSEYPDIWEQMKNVLVMHDHFFSHFNHSCIKNHKIIDCSGHIEIPTKEFWIECKKVLLGMSHILEHLQINKEFVKSCGNVKIISNQDELSNLIMTGVAVPAIAVQIGGKRYPLSFRNMVNVIIEYYAKKTLTVNLANSICDFLSYTMNNIINETVKFCDREKVLPYTISGIVKGKNKIYFFITSDIHKPDIIDKLIKDVFVLISNGEWALLCPSNNVLQINNKHGDCPSINNIRIVIIDSNLSTSYTCFKLPKSIKKFQFLPLIDFISLFDSFVNIDEFEEFILLKEKHERQIYPRFISTMDLFSALRKYNYVLIPGAIDPILIMVDPHMGSNWRYDELKKYWKAMPLSFPTCTMKWYPYSQYQGNICLIGKDKPFISWSTQINHSTIHFYTDFQSLIKYDSINVQLLKLFLECICDAFSQRKDILNSISFGELKKISVKCDIDYDNIVFQKDGIRQPNKLSPLLDELKIITKKETSIELLLKIQLPLFQYKVSSATDASVQAELCDEFFKVLSPLINFDYPLNIKEQIKLTSTQPLRATLSRYDKGYDTPERKPIIPEPKHYLLARKHLAEIVKEQGISERRYQLNEAKEIINRISDIQREKVHSKILCYHPISLWLFAMNQFDAYISENDILHYIMKMSLKHEVTYDRAKELAEENTEFIRQSENYRYLLECTLSLSSTNLIIPTEEDIQQLLADIDWLIVLYITSDMLHYNIDVGGISIDSDYIPEVFFSEDSVEKEEIFFKEQASYKLGIDLTVTDTVEANISDKMLEELNRSFMKDLGFNYSTLLHVLETLQKWARCNVREPELSYYATIDDIITISKKFIKSESNDKELEKAINFLILKPNEIRFLLGSQDACSDVPIFEHNKRGTHYNIKPLIKSDENIYWGAGSVNRTLTIWKKNIINGYLPADFNWKNVNQQVRVIKESIEKQLEIKSTEIVKRFTSKVKHGIDFRRRFPNEKFEDVGDFDTLAYLPEKNIWIMIECKYNKPYFCIKDLRRLRETIFGREGKATDKGQIGKVIRRYDFLESNLYHIKKLLQWDDSNEDKPRIINLYVSINIYWWLRNPPYATNIDFVQVDALNEWLKKNM